MKISVSLTARERQSPAALAMLDAVGLVVSRPRRNLLSAGFEGVLGRLEGYVARRVEAFFTPEAGQAIKNELVSWLKLPWRRWIGQ